MITIRKSLANYINTEVFINPLNLPVYQKSENPFVNEDCEDLKSIINRLDIILKAPHQEFWCHIIYDPSILNSLHSFCSNAKRPYEMLFHSKQFSKLEREIHKQYYLLILRIMTNKEISIPEFSNESFGALIYDNFIVDIPLLFDICSLYGEENSEIITKMLLYIFSCQPLYISDLRIFSTETIKIVSEKINDLVNNKKDNGFLATTNQNPYDVLFYLLDVSYSWYIMLKCVKSKHEIISILYNEAFHKSIETYFEKFIPYMQGKIDNFETSDPDLLKKQLSVLCYYLISIWRLIFVGEFLNPLQNTSNQICRTSEENFSIISDCITVISNCQENPNFADAMYLLFPIDEDFQVIFDIVHQDKDEYYSDFVNESVIQIRKDIESRHTMFSLKSNSSQVSNISSPRNSCIKLSQNPELIEVNVNQVLEIFPDFTNREIQAYMSLYGCNADHLLDSLLAGAIDVTFVKSEAARVDDRASVSAKTTAALLNHRNIYDGDALDTGRVTTAQLHIGKRQKTFTDTIDPSLRNMILDIVVQQDEEESDRLVADAMSLGITSNLNYEDEFDDVYGISHDGITIDSKNTDDTTTKDTHIEPEIKTGKEPNRTTQFNNKSMPGGGNQDETNSDRVIMEPSKVKFSNYDKRQKKKQRFHDGPQKAPNGYVNHRVGHTKKENDTAKRDHRSKADRNNTFY